MCNDWVGAKIFPFVDDDRDLLHYKRSALAKNDSYRLLIVVVLFSATFASRCNLDYAESFDPYFICAISTFFVCFTLYLLIYIPMIISELYLNRSNTLIYIYARKILNSRLRVIAEQLVPVVLSLSLGLFLYARVIAGQCSDMNNAWTVRRCNPCADQRSIPHDQTILCYLAPPISQLLVKGARFQIILLSWATSTLFVIISLSHVHGLTELWTALYSVFFLWITIEVERLMRFSYGQNNELVHDESKRSEFAIAVMRRGHTYAIKKVSMIHLLLHTHTHFNRIEYKSYKNPEHYCILLTIFIACKQFKSLTKCRHLVEIRTSDSVTASEERQA